MLAVFARRHKTSSMKFSTHYVSASMRHFRLLSSISVIVLAMNVAGCSNLAGFGETKVDPTLPAEQLYNEGLALSNQKHYGEASKKFELLNKQHPYSDYARKATVMSAFTNHSAGSYDDAALAAQRYLSLYPGAEDSAYMHFLLADSFYRQIPTVERDQAQTQKALEAMEAMVVRYPKSEYAPKMKDKIIFARDQLAGKEMEVGRYYLANRDYLAGINRFRTVVEKYPNTRHVEEALYRLVEANLALGIASEAQVAASVLGHNFPQSPWYKDAYALLQKGDLKPTQSKDSWITRALAGKFGAL